MRSFTDEQLLSLVQQDNEKAFETIIYRYNADLYKLIYRRIRVEADTKDILQDIFISFWKNRHTINNSGNLLPYLSKAAYYAVIDWQLQHKKILARQSELLKMPEPVELSHESHVISEELKEQVYAEANKMNTVMRNVFLASRWELKSISEIAQEQQLSQQTVKNYLTLALRRIRLKLKVE